MTTRMLGAHQLRAHWKAATAYIVVVIPLIYFLWSGYREWVPPATLIVIVAFVVASGAYYLRRHHQMAFGVIEVVVGGSLALKAFAPDHRSNWTASMGFIAAVYLIVQGLDSFGAELSVKSERWWSAVFGPKS